MSGSFVHKIIIAGCRWFTGRLPSGPHLRGTSMPSDDHPSPTSQARSRGLTRVRLVLYLGLAVLSVGLVLASLAVGNDGTATSSPTDSSAAPEPSQTTSSADVEAELVARLRGILAQRDEAYRTRDPQLLKRIYTVDCPCLESDTNAIRDCWRVAMFGLAERPQSGFGAWSKFPIAFGSS